jgi:hypothetical protein
MIVVGLMSLAICAVTIPALYILIGLVLNALYTLSWIFEITIIRHIRSEKATRIYALAFFWAFLAASAIAVLGFSLRLLL